MIDELYVEGPHTVNLSLSNPAGADIATPNTAVLTINDNDTTLATTNPLDNADARFFVRQHYYHFLNRLPDQSGFDYWAGQITQCGTDQTCINSKRIECVECFLL